MGIIDTLKDKRRIRARQKEESKAFRGIIERRNTFECRKEISN